MSGGQKKEWRSKKQLRGLKKQGSEQPRRCSCCWRQGLKVLVSFTLSSKAGPGTIPARLGWALTATPKGFSLLAWLFKCFKGLKRSEQVHRSSRRGANL